MHNFERALKAYKHNELLYYEPMLTNVLEGIEIEA